MDDELMAIPCSKCASIIGYSEGNLYEVNTWKIRCPKCVKVIDR